MIGFSIGLVLTITVCLWFQKAMPALLFILPIQTIAVFAACYSKYGKDGVIFLIKFDEEKALKTG